MKLVFMGSSPFAVPALSLLIEKEFDIQAVYCRAPKPAGRGMKLTETPTHQAAIKADLPVFTPKSLRSEEEIERLKTFNPDAIIVAAYGLLLPQAVLDIPRYGCLNIHASLLPRWRGAAPIHRAIMSGDDETGVCIMRMSAGLDEGAVYDKAKFPLSADVTTGAAHDALAEIGAELLLKTLSDLTAGQAKAAPQPAEGVTYAEKIRKEEAKIDFNRPAEDVLRHIHGLSPFPGAFFTVNDKRYKILEAELSLEPHHCEPGVFIDDRLTIACGKQAVRIKKLQKEGKTVQKAEDFLKSSHALVKNQTVGI